MRIRNIHSSLANYIKNSPKIQKVLVGIEKNPAMYNSLICAGIGIIAKPATIMLMPSKDEEMKKDNKYGIARAVSTGLIDFCFAFALFSPLNKSIDRAGRDLYKKRGSIYFQNKEMVTNAKSMMNRGLRFLTLPLFAFLKFFAIPPTMNLLFKKDKVEYKK